MRRAAQFLRNVASVPSLRDEVRRSNCYRELAEISNRTGEPCSGEELRGAFRARNAWVISREMMRRGLLDGNDLGDSPSLDRALWERIAALDLTPVRKQLTDYQGWTEQRVSLAECRYRRFLYLKVTLPEGKASPSPEVDEFWHQHIINTERYGPDCERVAGRFLHHIFLSPENPEDARELEHCRLITCASYEALFDEPYEETVGTALLSRWAPS